MKTIQLKHNDKSMIHNQQQQQQHLGNRPTALLQQPEQRMRGHATSAAATNNSASATNGDDRFPIRLHHLINAVQQEGRSDVISWTPDGKGFIIHKPKVFAASIMPNYFNQTRYKSFQRQLNLYKFDRRPSGKVNGIYYHPLFVRDSIEPCLSMHRSKLRVLPKKPTSNTAAHLVGIYQVTPAATAPASMPIGLCPAMLDGSLKSEEEVLLLSSNRGLFLDLDGAMDNKNSRHYSDGTAAMLSLESTLQQSYATHKNVGQNHPSQPSLSSQQLCTQPFTVASMTGVFSSSTPSYSWQKSALSGNRFAYQNNSKLEDQEFAEGHRSAQALPVSCQPILTETSESLSDFVGRMDAVGGSLSLVVEPNHDVRTTTSEITSSIGDEDSIESLDYIDLDCLDYVGPVTDWED